jgi:DNA-binding transcriptional ArsR family regulator
MPETMYRASRCCRILGNPTAYLIVRFLGNRRKTPTEISLGLGLSLPAVSTTLRQLRNIDAVRYETSGKTRQYWVKDPGVLDVLSALEALVRTMRKKRL